MTTKVDAFIADLDGGMLEQKLAKVLSQVAGAVIDYDRKGKVVLELDITKIGSGYQVKVDHVLKFEQPTMRGKVREDEKTSTPMHVGTGGAMSFFPENQAQLFTKKGEVNINNSKEVN